jgi:phosphate transport system protein
MNIAKNLQYGRINKAYEMMATTVMRQFILIKELIANQWKEPHYEEFLKNEDLIDGLETLIMEEVPNFVILFSPKAKELRKIIATHESVWFLEYMGDALVAAMEKLRSINLASDDFNDFRQILLKTFEELSELVNTASFSFFKDNAPAALEVLEDACQIDDLAKEISDTLVASFQDLSLSGQELHNIISLNGITSLVENIKEHAIGIAKSTIFATEGKNTRHKESSRIIIQYGSNQTANS